VTDAPITERPSLEQTECKPDVLPRLAAFGQILGQTDEPPTADMVRWGAEVLADAAEVIAGLRASNQTRLRLINEAKAERDEARAELAALRAAMTEER
jgi:hypothetical protein